MDSFQIELQMLPYSYSERRFCVPLFGYICDVSSLNTNTVRIQLTIESVSY